jgi:hypothetical protein
MAANAPVLVEDAISLLTKRYGKPVPFGRSRLLQFGTALTCSINYSKKLRGDKFFFGLAKEAVDPKFTYPKTKLGEFALLVCGTVDKIVVLPRAILLEMTRNVPTRKLDIFHEDKAFILQTTGHPKLNVTEFLNQFPQHRPPEGETDTTVSTSTADRSHVKIQSHLIRLGQAEGCSVWVPPNDRVLSYRGTNFATLTLDRLPNFGFEENTRRIVHNIDVLWLTKNIIRKAFEVESTTSIYSGLLRLNDLVLAQPNNQIQLYIVADKRRRERVFNQLLRPSFQELAPQCELLSFDAVEEAISRIESLKLGKSGRVSGLLEGERFTIPDRYIYPSGV